MQLSEDQIFALAPDEASKKAGKDLSNPAKWISKGINERALWGECQGSGSKPYQTQVDLSNIAFKCSCPSRKFPCKHGLGLLLLRARQPGLFATAVSPAWVDEWINKRGEKEEKKVEKAAKPVDENAQAKRVQAREQKVNEGIQDLLLWIKDIIRNGILAIPEKKAGYWDGMAKRLVDNQATGLAGRVKALGTVNFWAEGWQTIFMDQLLQLYLVATGYQNLTLLEAVLQQDIKTAVGFTLNQEELKQTEGVTDTWLVLGKQTTIDERLTIERNWLYGIQSNRYALVLQFYVNGQSGQLALTPGMNLRAELVFVPSVLPLRAIVKTPLNSGPNMAAGVKYFSGWQQVAEYETQINSGLPFHDELPYLIKGIKPVQYHKQWWLLDSEQQLMPLPADYKNLWRLLALSGGEALNMVVIGKENKFEPMGLWQQETYKAI